MLGALAFVVDHPMRRKLPKTRSRLATPVPEVLRLIGSESRRKGTDTLSLSQIDRVIKAARARKPRR
jgi:hypothetical protein